MRTLCLLISTSHLLSLNLSIVDYVLHSLNVFINTFTVLFAVALIVVIALCFRSCRVAGFLKHISKDRHRTAAPWS